MTTEFVKACNENEIEEGKLKEVEIDDKQIALARFQGEVYAIDNICTHDGGTLSDGDVVKCQVQCPRHGARFDLKTGAVTRMPAVLAIGTYETKIENGEVFIAIPR